MLVFVFSTVFFLCIFFSAIDSIVPLIDMLLFFRHSRLSRMVGEGPVEATAVLEGLEVTEGETMETGEVGLSVKLLTFSCDSPKHVFIRTCDFSFIVY